MSTASLQLPQVDGAPFRSRDCPPPSDQTIDWFMTSVRPALKQLANSWVIDFRLLYNAAETLPPADQSAWRTVVRQLQTKATVAYGFSHPSRSLPVRLFTGTWAIIRSFFSYYGKEQEWRLLHDLFRRLIGDLNANWFIPRSLFLYPYAEDQPDIVPDLRLWETANIALAAISREDIYPFADGFVPMYFVSHLRPQPVPSSRNPCYYDPLLQIVMIDTCYTAQLMYEVQLAARADDLIDKYLFMLGRWDGLIPAVERTYCQLLDKLFPQTKDLCVRFGIRVYFEELRHGMDAIRAGPFTNLEEHSQRLGDTLLRRNGRLRQLVWEPARTSRGTELLRGEKVELGHFVTELSGQMTAAVPHPGLVLLEWWRKLALLANSASDPRHQLSLLTQHTNHKLAAILGTILLGEHLNCGPPLSWSMLCEPDFSVLADLAWKVVKHPLAELRLALKAVYQNEFNHPIDELPFPEILPSGELQNHIWDAAVPAQANTAQKSGCAVRSSTTD